LSEQLEPADAEAIVHQLESDDQTDLVAELSAPEADAMDASLVLPSGGEAFQARCTMNIAIV
jgi:hypothetical protein